MLDFLFLVEEVDKYEEEEIYRIVKEQFQAPNKLPILTC